MTEVSIGIAAVGLRPVALLGLATAGLRVEISGVKSNHE